MRKQGFWESIINTLHPCVHQWQVIETLKDDPADPRTITLVRECTICGEIDTDIIQGPSRAPSRHICPPHKWTNIKEIQIIDNKNIMHTGRPAVLGWNIVQQCSECGDMRTMKQGFHQGNAVVNPDA